MEEKEEQQNLKRSYSIDADRISQKDKDFEDYSCKMCLNLSLDIQECTQCQNIFCLECIKDWKKKKENSCPFKCTPWILGKAHRIYRNTIANTKIHCENLKLENGQEGCQEVVPFESIKKHENEECQFRKILCLNSGCNRKILYKDLQAHDLNCEYKQIPCENCGVLMKEQKNNEHNCVQQLSLKINYLEKKIEQMYTKEEVDQKMKEYVSIDYFKRYQEAVEKKIAAIINQDFQGDYGKLTKQCPQGHELKIIKLNDAYLQNLVCDLCGNRPKIKGIPSYRCHICDFDKCQNCLNK